MTEKWIIAAFVPTLQFCRVGDLFTHAATNPQAHRVGYALQPNPAYACYDIIYQKLE